MQKLLLYIQDLSCNGSSKHLIRILPYLMAEFETLLVLNSDLGTNDLSSDLPQKLRVTYLNGSDYNSTISKLVEVITLELPDVVISLRDEGNYCALMAKKILKMKPLPFFVCLVQQHYTQQYKSSYNFRKKLFFKYLLKLYKQADLLIPSSEGLAIDLTKSAPALIEKIKPIYNAGFDDAHDKLSAEVVRNKWINNKMRYLAGLQKRFKLATREDLTTKILELGSAVYDDGYAPIILSCCSFKKKKNLELLIRAFAIVQKQRDARLLLVGADNLELDFTDEDNKKSTSEQLKSYVTKYQYQLELDGLIKSNELEKKVAMINFQKNSYKFYSKADVTVLTSSYEGFPTTLIESMIAECPVIACNCSAGPNEIIEDGKSGFLVRSNDANELAHNILVLLNKPALQYEFRKAGVAQAQKFSALKSFEKLKDAIMKLKR